MGHTPLQKGMPESIRRINQGETLRNFKRTQIGFTRDRNNKIIKTGIITESTPKEVRDQFTEFSKPCNSQEELNKEMLKLHTDNGETIPKPNT